MVTRDASYRVRKGRGDRRPETGPAWNGLEWCPRDTGTLYASREEASRVAAEVGGYVEEVRLGRPA